MKPDYAEAHNNLGFTLQEEGRLDEAETSLTDVVALDVVVSTKVTSLIFLSGVGGGKDWMMSQ